MRILDNIWEISSFSRIYVEMCDLEKNPTFKTSLLKSDGSLTLRMILVPFGSMPPPDLTSFVLCPQESQFVAIITTSLKWGISEI